MVGLVIVSHSRRLAEALVELVDQMVNGQVPITYAAGVGDERSEFGTDALEIAEAIQEAYSDDGVLVLMDLGSAILSAELAVELIPEEMQSKVKFCAAPVVEGAISASVQASLGSDLDTVCQEAKQALLPKIEQLGGRIDDPIEAPAAMDPPSSRPAINATISLENEHGLHARPAAKFVQLAAHYDAEITVKNQTLGKGPVSARSLNALATLGAVRGHQINIEARGTQAKDALAALERLVEDNFGEQESPETEDRKDGFQSSLSGKGSIQAVAVSEGFAQGPVYHYKPPLPPVPQYQAEDPDKEWRSLQDAIERTTASINERRRQVSNQLGPQQAAIFEAHALILSDPEILEAVRGQIYQEKKNAAQAWHQKIQETADAYRQVDDPYLVGRAMDVEDVGNQVLSMLVGTSPDTSIKLDSPAILVTHDLTPTQTAQLDMSKILGIITVAGGPTSHSAILARAIGIPAIAGADAAITALPEEIMLAIDGFKGVFWIDPSAEIQISINNDEKAWRAQQAEYLLRISNPAVTTDGRQIHIAANVGSVYDAEAAMKYGAEGVGLLRTEFLFLTRTTPPSETEQYDTLSKIGQVMEHTPVIVRTLDIGGDKFVPYLDMAEEGNPFLGVRAIRMSLSNLDLFIPQLRAILRASGEANLSVMFPMITNLSEVQRAKELLAEAHRQLTNEEIPHRWPINTGIMIETPASALLSPVLAPEIDFFSIGTNDLTQYTLAAERGNPALSNLADALHPAVLNLIQGVVEAAHAQNKWVGVCGELAGDPIAVPILIGLGVDELSLNPAGIPRAKELVRSLNYQETRQLVEMALQAESSSQIRQMASAMIEEGA